MALPPVSNSPITGKEAAVEKDGLTRADTGHDDAVHTDGKSKKNEDALHLGSSDSEQLQKEFQEGGYGW